MESNAITARSQLLANENIRLRRALLKISRSHDCGCYPCVGQCTSQEALQITVDAMRDEANEALQFGVAEWPEFDVDNLNVLEAVLRDGSFYQDYDHSMELLTALSKHLNSIQALKWIRRK